MATFTGGSFWGYRAGVFPITGRVCLPVWELDGPVPRALKVFQGDAPDAYGAMQTFPEQSLIILVQVWNNKAVFQLSEDGQTYGEEREIDPDKKLGSWLRRFAARGFRIKNKAAGLTAEYQVVTYW